MKSLLARNECKLSHTHTRVNLQWSLLFTQHRFFSRDFLIHKLSSLGLWLYQLISTSVASWRTHAAGLIAFKPVTRKIVVPLISCQLQSLKGFPALLFIKKNLYSRLLVFCAFYPTVSSGTCPSSPETLPNTVAPMTVYTPKSCGLDMLSLMNYFDSLVRVSWFWRRGN